MSHPLKPRFDAIRRELDQKFLAKEEIIRLMLVAAIAGEHMVLIGPPGTAKSALIRAFARLIDARYFEYLLTRFSEPNELFGPVDIQSFRSGSYRRVVSNMLPEAEIVFLDEAFKANSAILNSLLTLLNERRFNNGAQLMKVPLISLFAASNEVPSSDNLDAIFDRFLLRVHSDNLDSYHFHELMTKGLALERASLKDEVSSPAPALPPSLSAGAVPAPPPLPAKMNSGAILSAADLHTCRRTLLERSLKTKPLTEFTLRAPCYPLTGVQLCAPRNKSKHPDATEPSPKALSPKKEKLSRPAMESPMAFPGVTSSFTAMSRTNCSTNSSLITRTFSNPPTVLRKILSARL
jgi:hypothetical protein